jgi:hypothetical protein
MAGENLDLDGVKLAQVERGFVGRTEALLDHDPAIVSL